MSFDSSAENFFEQLIGPDSFFSQLEKFAKDCSREIKTQHLKKPRFEKKSAAAANKRLIYCLVKFIRE